MRLRGAAGGVGDGAGVVNKVLALGASGVPMLAINDLRGETDEREQARFANLLIGLYGMYRNPVAHDPRTDRGVSDDELLEMLTTLSMVHRRLDGARLT